MMDHLAVAARGGLDQRAKLFQHVVGRFDQLRPVADQLVAAARRAAIDVARHGEHLAALLHRVPRGDQRPAALGRPRPRSRPATAR